MILPHPGQRLTRENLNTIQRISQRPGQPPEHLPSPVTYRSQVFNLPSDLSKYGLSATQRDLPDMRRQSALLTPHQRHPVLWRSSKRRGIDWVLRTLDLDDRNPARAERRR